MVKIVPSNMTMNTPQGSSSKHKEQHHEEEIANAKDDPKVKTKIVPNTLNPPMSHGVSKQNTQHQKYRRMKEVSKTAHQQLAQQNARAEVTQETAKQVPEGNEDPHDTHFK